LQKQDLLMNAELGFDHMEERWKFWMEKRLPVLP
jgi:hypothetical protein